MNVFHIFSSYSEQGLKLSRFTLKTVTFAVSCSVQDHVKSSFEWSVTHVCFSRLGWLGLHGQH